MNNFLLKTVKLGWVAFHSGTFQLKFLDFQSNQYKKLVPVLSRLRLPQLAMGLKKVACENSRPSSLRNATRAGSEEGRLFSQAIKKERIGLYHAAAILSPRRAKSFVFARPASH